jgi:hypothetical protein
MNTVPYNETNKSVVIPKLSPIIIEAGSLLDTAFSSLYKDRKKKPNINDFKKYYEDKLKLSSIKILLFSEEPTFLQPFEKWKDESSSLSWWFGYNKLKHDRNNGMLYSTLDNAIYSMAGLSIFLARNVDFFDAAYRHELIITHYNPSVLQEQYDRFWMTNYSEVSFENDIFLIPFGKNILRNNPNEINTALIESKKIKHYLVRWE